MWLGIASRNPVKLIAWADRVVAATAAVVRWRMEHRANGAARKGKRPER